jgi:hypothetical protein
MSTDGRQGRRTVSRRNGFDKGPLWREASPFFLDRLALWCGIPLAVDVLFRLD